MLMQRFLKRIRGDAYQCNIHSDNTNLKCSNFENISLTLSKVFDDLLKVCAGRHPNNRVRLYTSFHHVIMLLQTQENPGHPIRKKLYPDPDDNAHLDTRK